MGSKDACNPFKNFLLSPVYFENAVIFLCPLLEGKSFPQNSKLSQVHENVQMCKIHKYINNDMYNCTCGFLYTPCSIRGYR